MRLQSIVAVACTLFVASSVSSSTSDEINKAIDYAKSGLVEEAKTRLIDLSYEETDSTYHPRIWYVLGSICFEQENYDGAYFHWGKVQKLAPNSPEADAIRDIKASHEFFATSWSEKTVADLQFINEWQMSRRLWSYEAADWKMNWNEIQDIALAQDFLDVLLGKYTTGDKRALLLFDKFLIFAGYNSDKFGFSHMSITDAENRPTRDSLLAVCEAISDTLHLIDGANFLYVRSQFLLGILNSPAAFLSSKLRLNNMSVPYFENVMAATSGEMANPYRIFASLWLRDYYSKKEDKR